MPQKVKCCDCAHECGIGFDAWCGLGFKHNFNIPHICAAFYNNEEYKDRKNNKITDFEFKDNIIILWKKYW